MGSDAQDWALVFFFLLFVVVVACTAGRYYEEPFYPTLFCSPGWIIRKQLVHKILGPCPHRHPLAWRWRGTRENRLSKFFLYIFFFLLPGSAFFSFILRIFIFIIIIFLRSRFVYLLGLLLLFFSGGSGRRRRQFGWLDLLTPFPLFSSSYSLPVSVLLIRLRKPRVSVLS